MIYCIETNKYKYKIKIRLTLLSKYYEQYQSWSIIKLAYGDKMKGGLWQDGTCKYWKMKGEILE